MTQQSPQGDNRRAPWLRRLRHRLLAPGWVLSGRLVGSYYQNLVAEHGLSPHALAERESQKDLEFYDQLLRDVPLAGPLSVLDIGCGMGDMIVYLQRQQLALGGYLGIDLVPAFVEHCRASFPSAFRFEVANFADPSFTPAERFDLVVNMGGLVSRVVAYEDYLAYSIEKMIGMARRHVAFNIITAVDRSLGNYANTDRVGQITYLPSARLAAILDEIAGRRGVRYTMRDARIYPDGVDTFVWVRVE